MAKPNLAKGAARVGGELPEETRAILGATTKAGRAARAGLGGVLANAGDELRGLWQSLGTPMGAANMASGFMGRFAVPAQVGLEASRDPKALAANPEAALTGALVRSQTPVGLFEQSPGWNQVAQAGRQQLTEALTAPGELFKPGGAGRISKRSAKNLVRMLQGIRQGFYDAPVASAMSFVAPALQAATAHAPVAGIADDAGMVAHHGTPHTFAPTEKNPLGEFDHSKMGSGEGAQAYGWGTYLAENPKIAKGYQKQLSTDWISAKTGTRYSHGMVFDLVSDASYNEMSGANAKLSAKFPGMRFPNNQWIRIAEEVLDWSETHSTPFLERHRVDPDLYDAYKAASDVASEFKKNRGVLYSVDVPDEHIANFLDYDAPATSQPELVTKAYEDLKQNFVDNEYGNAVSAMAKLPQNATGANLYRSISLMLGGDEAASRYLASRGVHGLKFFDSSSRKSSSTKPNTRNLVIFDPSITTITGRK